MTLRAVLAGCGDAAGLWLPTLAASPLVEVVALADLDRSRAEAAAAAHGLRTTIETDVAEALERTGASVLLDLTPPDRRLENVRTAFALGCDVIGEKPMGATLADAVAIVQESGRLRRRYAAMQNHRFHPGMRALRAVVERGDLGRLGLISADLYKAVPVDGWRTASANPLLTDMAIHSFDQARYLAGSDPIRVRARSLTRTGAGVLLAEAAFADGSELSYRGSWESPGGHTSWFGTWRLDGSEATAVWNGEDDAFRVVTADDEHGVPKDDRRPLAAAWSGTPSHPAAIEALLGALAAGEPLETDCADNLTSMAMVHAAVASTVSGDWVDVAEVLDRAKPTTSS
ncbi:MAG TPA: Gfo/Idh/MocA family oxidoreductase [Gaiellales bacterium]|jgi:predicted dehydrogenase|nr:Gfo/Idh/MocA family oxidoreductase [Gaiellales bacterium]